MIDYINGSLDLLMCIAFALSIHFKIYGTGAFIFAILIVIIH